MLPFCFIVYSYPSFCHINIVVGRAWLKRVAKQQTLFTKAKISVTEEQVHISDDQMGKRNIVSVTVGIAQNYVDYVSMWIMLYRVCKENADA
jgi:hypothetical protein